MRCSAVVPYLATSPLTSGVTVGAGCTGEYSAAIGGVRCSTAGRYSTGTGAGSTPHGSGSRHGCALAAATRAGLRVLCQVGGSDKLTAVPTDGAPFLCRWRLKAEDCQQRIPR